MFGVGILRPFDTSVIRNKGLLDELKQHNKLAIRVSSNGNLGSKETKFPCIYLN